MPEPIASRLMEAGIVPFCGINETLAAAETAAAIGRAWCRPMPSPCLDTLAAHGEIHLLTEAEAKAELAASGLTVPRGLAVRTVEDAVTAAGALGFPVALKGLGVAHKTEAGAVKLNLSDAGSVAAAAGAMAHVSSGYLVEKMVAAPVAELIVGATRDPVAGLYLTIGAGGILVELLEDSRILVLPATEEEISAALSQLRVTKLIMGYRNGRKGDWSALVRAVASAADYVVSNASMLEELDINPLMVLADGEGVVAADALIRRRR
jgi:acetate---CoA ligase (ADP-forming)